MFVYLNTCVLSTLYELAGPELCPTTVPKCWLKQSQAGAPASLKCACTGTVGPVSLMRPTAIKNALCMRELRQAVFVFEPEIQER